MSLDTNNRGAAAAFETALDQLANSLPQTTREQLVTRILTQRENLVREIAGNTNAISALQQLYPDANNRNIDAVLSRLERMIPMSQARSLTHSRTESETPDERRDVGRSLNQTRRSGLSAKKILALAVGGVALWVAWPYVASWLHRQFTRVPQTATELAMGRSRALRQADPIISPTPSVPTDTATDTIIGPRGRGPILSPMP